MENVSDYMLWLCQGYAEHFTDRLKTDWERLGMVWPARANWEPSALLFYVLTCTSLSDAIEKDLMPRIGRLLFGEVGPDDEHWALIVPRLERYRDADASFRDEAGCADDNGERRLRCLTQALWEALLARTAAGEGAGDTVPEALGDIVPASLVARLRPNVPVDDLDAEALLEASWDVVFSQTLAVVGPFWSSVGSIVQSLDRATDLSNAERDLDLIAGASSLGRDEFMARLLDGLAGRSLPRREFGPEPDAEVMECRERTMAYIGPNWSDLVAAAAEEEINLPLTARFELSFLYYAEASHAMTKREPRAGDEPLRAALWWLVQDLWTGIERERVWGSWLEDRLCLYEAILARARRAPLGTYYPTIAEAFTPQLLAQTSEEILDRRVSGRTCELVGFRVAEPARSGACSVTRRSDQETMKRLVLASLYEHLARFLNDVVSKVEYPDELKEVLDELKQMEEATPTDLPKTPGELAASLGEAYADHLTRGLRNDWEGMMLPWGSGSELETHCVAFYMIRHCGLDGDAFVEAFKHLDERLIGEAFGLSPDDRIPIVGPRFERMSAVTEAFGAGKNLATLDRSELLRLWSDAMAEGLLLRMSSDGEEHFDEVALAAALPAEVERGFEVYRDLSPHRGDVEVDWHALVAAARDVAFSNVMSIGGMLFAALVAIGEAVTAGEKDVPTLTRLAEAATEKNLKGAQHGYGTKRLRPLLQNSPPPDDSVHERFERHWQALWEACAEKRVILPYTARFELAWLYYMVGTEYMDGRPALEGDGMLRKALWAIVQEDWVPETLEELEGTWLTLRRPFHRAILDYADSRMTAETNFWALLCEPFYFQFMVQTSDSVLDFRLSGRACSILEFDVPKIAQSEIVTPFEVELRVEVYRVLVESLNEHLHDFLIDIVKVS